MTDPRDREVLGWADAQAPEPSQQPRQLFPDPAAAGPPAPARPESAGEASPRPDAATAVDLDETVGGQSSPTPPRARRAGLRARLNGVSLRARLVAIVVILLALALTVSGAGFLTQLRSTLVGQVDHQLSQALGPVSHAIFRDSGARGGPLPSNFVVNVYLDATAGGPASSQTFRPAIGSGLPDANPDFPRLTAEQADARELKSFTIGSVNGTARWRVIAAPLENPDTHQLLGTLSIATPLTQVDAAVSSLRFIIVLVVVLITGAGAVLGWFAIRRSFRPLVEMEETAAAIAAGDLSRRIPERPASTEVGRLTRSLNGMLTQIESAFRAREASEARTRRFAADASHELRTPLVSIRGFAELYRQGAVPPDEVPRTMRRIEDEAKRMGSLVEDLLLLARLDEQRPTRHEPVDLAVLAGDAVHDARGLDAARAVTLTGLTGRGPEPAVVTGDEDRLRQVVANLVANAVRHTPAGTPIEVAVGRDTGPDGDTAVLEVRDHGQGLTPEQAERVFERFYRIDSSRRRGTGGGSGLGLSIVAAVVAAHSGQVRVVPTPGGGATFQVTLPAGPDGPQAAAGGTPAHPASVAPGGSPNGAAPGEGIGVTRR